MIPGLPKVAANLQVAWLQRLRGKGSPLGICSIYWRSSLQALNPRPVCIAAPIGNLLTHDYFQAIYYNAGYCNDDNRHRQSRFRIKDDPQESARSPEFPRSGAAGVETFRSERLGHGELPAALGYAFMSRNICLLLSRWSTR